MNYEVEQKFRVADLPALEAKLQAKEVQLAPPMRQVDSYFAHPLRDFGQTDEALRIRRVGDANYVTYKGPKIDATTKTRKELELPLVDGDETAGQIRELLVTLDFRPVADVIKQRRYGQLDWEGYRVEIALDDVEEVGLFAELELAADDDGVDAARACLASLAAELGLVDSERRSYLELLVENRGKASQG